MMEPRYIKYDSYIYSNCIHLVVCVENQIRVGIFLIIKKLDIFNGKKLPLKITRKMQIPKLLFSQPSYIITNLTE